MDIQLWIDQLTKMIANSQAMALPTCEIVGALWVIQIVNFILRYRLNFLGIWPRKLWGLPGIFFAPFLHGSFEHLFFNSIPLFILVNILLVYGFHFFFWLSFIIILAAGAGTWLLGRPGVHVGASGIVMGYWGFLLTQSILYPSALTVISGLLCLYYLGSLWLNLLPGGLRTSWEGHLFGCLAGVGYAFLA